ncbi:MAG: LysE family translocator [Rhodospirillaceae bacterium]|mgnify:CR=1 FL=1|jgi:homoserine/homoserine lactone efflux protein|nr:LysE family translocator [Rhodospirillaceae bacterium]MBT4218733.1 LysE family translocator [Rhodospirillaceae bacterium]MBT4463096.1 LysE family translocator [Rhodospirillaceae bacterium]MBT5013823.1 LysE family translocator [Rhodospirillaceae bacterium]MBT5308680.1 LysE family translocator [Rhodospirillaceae bacterium]
MSILATLPIDPVLFGGFLLTAVAVIVSPGPDTVLILRYSLSSGHRVGLATVLGVQLGLVVHTTLAVAGISLLIASSPLLFKSVAVLGAAYLFWLGLQGMVGDGVISVDNEQTSISEGRAIRDAILCNILNPKVIILFLALFPNFIDTSRDDASMQLLFLAVVLIIINVLWQAPMAWAAQAARRLLTTPSVNRAVSRASGIILIGFAVLMIYEHVMT